MHKALAIQEKDVIFYDSIMVAKHVSEYKQGKLNFDFSSNVAQTRAYGFKVSKDIEI